MASPLSSHGEIAGETQASIIRVQIVRPSGGELFNDNVATTETVDELLARVRPDDGRYILLHGDSMLSGSQIIGSVLGPSDAVLTLISLQELRVTAKNIAGAHTNNPSYFRRVNEGTEEEYLELVTVCWFQVGGTFQNVLPGKYRLRIEAARNHTLKLKGRNGEPFDVSVKDNAFSAQWDAQAVLTENFQEFDVGSWMSQRRAKSL
jgi:hypothetical protein